MKVSAAEAESQPHSFHLVTGQLVTASWSQEEWGFIFRGEIFVSDRVGAQLRLFNGPTRRLIDLVKCAHQAQRRG
jgi:hypothetical protein